MKGADLGVYCQPSFWVRQHRGAGGGRSGRINGIRKNELLILFSRWVDYICRYKLFWSNVTFIYLREVWDPKIVNNVSFVCGKCGPQIVSPEICSGWYA